MTCQQARELMNGDIVYSGEYVGEVLIPKLPRGWFAVRWGHGTETRHDMNNPNHVADLTLRDEQEQGGEK